MLKLTFQKVGESMVDKIMYKDQEFLPIVVSKKPQKITINDDTAAYVSTEILLYLDKDFDTYKITGMSMMESGDSYTPYKMSTTSDYCIYEIKDGKKTGIKYYHVNNLMTHEENSVNGWISSDVVTV